jgi:hypothetical protein
MGDPFGFEDDLFRTRLAAVKPPRDGVEWLANVGEMPGLEA